MRRVPRVWGGVVCGGPTVRRLVKRGFAVLQVLFKRGILVTQSSLTLCNPMDCSLTGSSVHGFL